MPCRSPTECDPNTVVTNARPEPRAASAMKCEHASMIRAVCGSIRKRQSCIQSTKHLIIDPDGKDAPSATHQKQSELAGGRITTNVAQHVFDSNSVPVGFVHYPVTAHFGSPRCVLKNPAVFAQSRSITVGSARVHVRDARQRRASRSPCRRGRARPRASACGGSRRCRPRCRGRAAAAASGPSPAGSASASS